MVAKTPNTASPAQSARRRRAQLASTRTPTDNIASFDVNNDEEERRQRKRSLLLSNNLLSPVAGHTTPRTKALNSAAEGGNARTHAGMTYAQLKEHNANCVKLSSENKINSKNAFALHLIDYMKFLVHQSSKEDNTTNFQVASCTLDAGVKIYAGRVDSVHAEAYKILGSLGRANEVESGGENEDGQPDEGANAEKQQRKKKATRGPGKTIEKNLKAINCDRFDQTFEVDPFFHKTSATFDEGGTGGLLLNHLHIKDESYELTLDSRNKVVFHEEPATYSNTNPVNLAPFKDMTSKLYEEKLEICPQFVDFLFTEWDRNSTELLGGHNEDDHRFDQDASGQVGLEWKIKVTHKRHLYYPGKKEIETIIGGFEDNGRSSVFGTQVFEPDEDIGGGIPSDDDYGRDADTEEPYTNSGFEPTAIADGREACFMSDNPGLVSAPTVHPENAGPLRLEFSLQPNEYSYFRQDVLETWAGPNHWKLKARSKDVSSNMNENNNETAKKRRQKKAAFTFDYDDDSNIKDIAKPGKASKTLSKMTLKKMSIQQTTLPEDIHYEAENFLKLFIKPSIKVRRMYSSTNEGENDLHIYNYDNKFDKDNFCPALEDDDDDGYDGGDDVMGNQIDLTYGNSTGNATHPAFDVTVGEQTFFGGDNLVSQPNKVDKIRIAYAKTAKRIDVRKLKKAMWESLSTSKDGKDKENIPENVIDNTEQLSKGDDDESRDEMSSFKDLYHVLPNKISQSASNNLSVPIAFVCLLYLANEKGLRLTGSEDLANFKIAQDIFDKQTDL